MNIAITRKFYAVKKGEGESAPYTFVEDRVEVMTTAQYTMSHDLLSVIELYQLHYEVMQCLRKTHCRTTYKSLMQTRNMLETEINVRLLVAGIKPIVKG